MNQMALLVERNWGAAWASLGAVRAEPPTIADDEPDVLRIYTPGDPETLLNIILRYSGAGPVTARQIEEVIAPFREHRLPFQWWLTRGFEPTGLRARLDALGMETWGGAAMMCLALDSWAPRIPAPPADTTLSRAINDDQTRAALDIICAVFYLPRPPMLRWTTLNPRFDLWLAWLGARPVAALATLLDGDTVGVYHVATVAGARRRGVAGALLRLALSEARDCGAHWATLTATPEARSLYEALGFRACGLLEQWMPGQRLARQITGAKSGYFDDYW
ncbi:MAG TPA: GNAT family N-acetyltransferase, partial [Ktedonobacterales bacterium]